MTSPHVMIKTMVLLCAFGSAASARPVSPARAVVRGQSEAKDRPVTPRAQQERPADRPVDGAGGRDRPSMRPPARGEQARDGRPTRPLWDRLNERERRRLRTFVERHFPDLFEELEWLETNRPRQANIRMRRLAPEMLRLNRLLDRDPEQARLAIKERRLDLQIIIRVRDYWASDSDVDRDELRDEITELSQSLFDVRLQRHKLEVERLRTRLAGLERRLEHAEQNRDSIIKRRISEKLDRRPTPNRRPDVDRRRDDLPKDDDS